MVGATVISAFAEARFPSRKDGGDNATSGLLAEEMKKQDHHEEEPIELELSNGSETDNDSEVELVLVGGELVAVHQTRSVGGDQAVSHGHEHVDDAGEETKRTATAQEPSQADKTQASSGHARSNRRKLAEIEPSEDEFLLRAVVACGAEFANPVIVKMVVWGAISQVCGGRFLNANAVRNHVSWLVVVWRDESHRVHADLTDELTNLLDQYEHVKKRAATVDRERNRAVVAKNQPRFMKQCIAKLMKLPGAVFSVQATTTEATTAQATEHPARLKETKERTKTIDPSMDEPLMELVVEKRPLARQGFRNTVTWAEIAQRMQSPLIQSGKDAQNRVEFLVYVFHNPTHSQHAKLTPKLRQSLVQYVSSDTLGTPNHKPRAAKAKPRSRTELSESSDGDGGSSETEMSEAEEDKEHKAAQPPTEREDDVLLREILRLRPFHAVAGKRVEVWAAVAGNVGSQLRRAIVFPTGRSCLSRMKAMLRVSRDPRKLSQNRLPFHQLKMLRLIATLIETRWPRLEADQTEYHHKLLGRIRKVLKTTSHVKNTRTDVSKRAVCSSHSEEEGNEGDKQEEQLADTDIEESNKQKRKRIELSLRSFLDHRS